MYGLPKDFDGGVFVGRTLEMICFAQYRLYLHFERGLTVSIESSFSTTPDRIIDVPVVESDLMRLIGSVVVAATGDDLGTLTLAFYGGDKLRVYDSSKAYESYTISYDGKELVV
jgi:uncharacterized protein DUF6188